MNHIVYASKSGNTKKLAEAMGRGLGVAPRSVEEFDESEATGCLFVGASIYGGSIDQALRQRLEGIRTTPVKKVVVFGTSAGKKNALEEIKTIFKGSGIEVSDKMFYCKGSFLIAHRGRPNAEDLKLAEAFASEMANH